MGVVTTDDGIDIFYKDWGSGQPIVFSHGWPLSADDWDTQMMFFLLHGYRVIAADRRGHGRSTQSDGGHDMDHYADDLAAVTAHLDLHDAIHVGHSTGGGEVVHYLARHGESRAAKAVLISSVPPLMLKTEANPGGLPKEVFDGLQEQTATNRAQFYRDLPEGPFYGYNRPGAKPSEGVIQNWWRQGMTGGAKAHYDGIVAFSQTDFTEDLKQITVPALVMHGDDDQIVPYADSGPLSAELLKNGRLITYKGFPHGMPTTEAETINADLLAFFKEWPRGEQRERSRDDTAALGRAIRWGRFGAMTSAGWETPPYDGWQATCDTLHAHTQLLGKLAVALATPEPQLQHAALRLTARGWETMPLPAPDGSGALVVLLDLHRHETVIEHSDGRTERVALTPNRSVGKVSTEVLAAVGRLVGSVRINPTPQEVSWSDPLDEDEEHKTYDAGQVATYFEAATRAALVLADLRAPYRGRSSPVNAWWGTFDLAVSLYSGREAEPPSAGFIMRNAGNAQQIEIGWWPGDARHAKPAFYGFAAPAPDGFAEGHLAPAAGGWSGELGEFILDWDDLIASPDPHATALEFGRAVLAHACLVCEWDPALAASAQGVPPPLS